MIERVESSLVSRLLLKYLLKLIVWKDAKTSELMCYGIHSETTIDPVRTDNSEPSSKFEVRSSKSLFAKMILM